MKRPTASNAEAFVRCTSSHVLPQHESYQSYTDHGTEGHLLLCGVINLVPGASGRLETFIPGIGAKLSEAMDGVESARRRRTWWTWRSARPSSSASTSTASTRRSWGASSPSTRFAARWTSTLARVASGGSATSSSASPPRGGRSTSRPWLSFGCLASRTRRSTAASCSSTTTATRRSSPRKPRRSTRWIWMSAPTI